MRLPCLTKSCGRTLTCIIYPNPLPFQHGRQFRQITTLLMMEEAPTVYFQRQKEPTPIGPIKVIPSDVQPCHDSLTHHGNLPKKSPPRNEDTNLICEICPPHPLQEYTHSFEGCFGCQMGRWHQMVSMMFQRHEMGRIDISIYQYIYI